MTRLYGAIHFSIYDQQCANGSTQRAAIGRSCAADVHRCTRCRAGSSHDFALTGLARMTVGRPRTRHNGCFNTVCVREMLAKISRNRVVREKWPQNREIGEFATYSRKFREYFAKYLVSAERCYFLKHAKHIYYSRRFRKCNMYSRDPIYQGSDS